MIDNAPMLAVARPPFRLRVWYEAGAVPVYRVEVDHVHEPSLRRRETIPCYHAPVWGIDADDMETIRATAEEMTRDLERELGGEKWAALRSPVL